MATTQISTNPITIPPVIIDPTVPVTDELIAALGVRNPDYRFETTADRRLIITPGTGFFPSGGEAELVYQVVGWNHERGLGHVSSSSGYFTQFDNAVKGPDCTYTSWESIDAQIPAERPPKAYEQIAPDVTFELTSPTDDPDTLDSKCRNFIANGIKVALLLISRSRSVAIYRPGVEPSTAENIREVIVGPEMLGFILNAQAVFDASIRRRPNT
jgi:Uma2 family endonuclease